MNILFGKPTWPDWDDSFKSLPYNVFINDLNNLNEIIECLIKNKIDLLIPMTFPQMYFVIDNKKIIEKYVREIACGSDKEIIDLADNKYKFYQFLRDNDFEKYSPNTYLIGHNNKIINIKTVNYPAIYKLHVCYGAKDSVIIKDYSKLVTQLTNGQTDYLIQEYIVSHDEYGLHGYVENGVILFSVCYKLSSEKLFYIQSGKFTNYVKVDFSSHTEIISQLFEKLNYTGFFCLGFKCDDQGRIKILELNPRAGGTFINNRDDLTELISTCFFKFKLNITFGVPRHQDWVDSLGKLENKVIFNDLNNIDEFVDEIECSDVLIPCTFEQMRFVIKHRKILDQKFKYILSGKSTFINTLLSSRNGFYQFMIRNGFSDYIPKKYLENKDIKFPCIVKKSGYSGQSVVVNCSEELEIMDKSGDCIVQEYIWGDVEYAGNFYVVDGVILYSVIYMKKFDSDSYVHDGKFDKYDKVVIDENYFEVIKNIFKTLEYGGFACVDFKIVNSSLKIFEINARLGGTFVSNKDDMENMISIVCGCVKK